MRSRRENVTIAAAAFAAMSHPRDEFFTLNFNERVWPGLPPPLAFTGNTEQLRAAVSAAPARGMTAVYDAVAMGLRHLEGGTNDRKALVVVSDGGDNASTLTPDDVIEQARGASAVIFAVTIVDPDNHDAMPRRLKTLASNSGGRTFTPAQPAEVVAAFEQIARELRSAYTIGFSAPDAPAGGFRRVRVLARAVDGRELITRTRAGYYAGPSSTDR